ncbi:hypothetical protein JVT61DRAFT_14131 [Boletus reticuloceps]|uniref:Uncharacterized protein n=1 Tax=Boletus reticuloceps TaxID=495285 RepID=A0A8I2YD50_9AGAM|nr:hypothetical protein JVT61DRAFT_14131 [Boletus reticuloceps]
MLRLNADKSTLAAIYLLAIVQFVRQSLQMYSVTRQSQLNINLLVRQDILYFFACVSTLSYHFSPYLLLPSKFAKQNNPLD